MFATKNNKEAGEHIHITDNQIATRITDLFEKYKFNVITKKEKWGIFPKMVKQRLWPWSCLFIELPY